MNTIKGDLDVILEFLEEHNKQELENEKSWIREHQIFGTHCQEWYSNSNPPSPKCFQFPEISSQKRGENFFFYPEHVKCPEDVPDPPLMSSFPVDWKITFLSDSIVKRKKIRLFQFLFEMLEDPGMAHCISWVQPSCGIFQFSSQNKDKLAEMWGMRKGNKNTMTYQKMSRALRNYARTGEITKVKRKLTYQFSLIILKSLQRIS